MCAISLDSIKSMLRDASAILLEHSQHLTDLDQEIGDGDMGITMAKIAGVFLGNEVQNSREADIGKFLMATGMAVNRSAASTIGTLTATAFMRGGKEVRGEIQLTPPQVASVLSAAVQGIQDRGKAKLGDKTIIDALHPAAAKFTDAISTGSTVAMATCDAAAAAEAGRDKVTPLRSKIGRAGWVGERTIGKVDTGCEMAVLVLKALA
jgi:dihydroxyacetone kinase-like protein